MELKSVSYLSPILRYDPVAEVVIFAHRNPATGDISSQIPSAEAVKARHVATGAGAEGPRVSIVA
jgi:hypothetical protein